MFKRITILKLLMLMVVLGVNASNKSVGYGGGSKTGGSSKKSPTPGTQEYTCIVPPAVRKVANQKYKILVPPLKFGCENICWTDANGKRGFKPLCGITNCYFAICDPRCSCYDASPGVKRCIPLKGRKQLFSKTDVCQKKRLY